MNQNKTDLRLRKLLRNREAGKATPRKKKGEDTTAVDLTKLPEMSESELVEVALQSGHATASRQLTREDLQSLILGDAEVEPEDPVQPLREKTWKFVEGNKSLMSSQMPCDLQCLQCPSRIVLECYTVNHDIVDL